MKNNQKSKSRKLNKQVSLALICIAAVVTWFKNENKEPSKTSTAPQPQQTHLSANTVSPDLSNYDTTLASDKFGQNKTAPIDYYMLSISWSPSFCEAQKQRNQGKIPPHLQFQCNEAAKFGWVIHGLWPQNANAKSVEDHPRFCQGDLPPVAEATIKQYMTESPGAKLLQGEWEKHGACAFDTAEDYFAKQSSLFHSLNLPGSELSHKELFAWMKKFNPQLKNVRLKAGRSELYICYNKQWQPIDCQ